MKKMDLQKSIIYGPLLSRRLGLSLGINLLPTNRKLCSFDCLYCQYGFTQETIFKNRLGKDFPKTKDILKEIKTYFSDKTSKNINYITLAGNGEPTLHPDFAEIVDGIIEIRDKYIPTCKLALLSNASTATNPKICETIKRFDKRIMKLDAGDDKMFKKINRANKNIDYDKLVLSLADLAPITLQTLFIEGSTNNTTKKHLTLLIEIYKKIKPDNIQIYSLDRTPADEKLKKVSPKKLFDLKKRILEETSIPVDVFV